MKNQWIGRCDNNISFSIIIPTYNRAQFIQKAIQSVLDQSYDNFELIIVDDGSTDNTEEVVNKYTDSRIKYYKKKNEERGAARNAGIFLASGDYVNFLDSDDLLYPNHLNEGCKFVFNNNNPEIFHLGYDVKSPEGRIINKIDSHKGDIGKKLIKGNFLSCNGVFIRRDIAMNLPFNEDRKLAAFEDWQLWLRMASRFPFYGHNIITSTVVNHDERSVFVTKKDPLIIRGEILLSSLKDDSKFMETFGDKLNILKGSINTYISLHLALTKQYQKGALLYLLKGIVANPMEIFKKRSLIILKYLVQ
ncbi:MAG: glycosyltransferase [Candidatus Cyclobacteriaceae bacterium M2_1C_046]